MRQARLMSDDAGLFGGMAAAVRSSDLHAHTVKMAPPSAGPWTLDLWFQGAHDVFTAAD